MRPYVLRSTATGNAQDVGASKTVNGYMAFLLFSVAGLACKWTASEVTVFVDDVCYSGPVYWISVVHAYSHVCGRVGVAEAFYCIDLIV